MKDISALVEQGKLADAIARARDALDAGVEAPLLLNLRAYWLESQNRPEDALADLERARVLAPDDPAVLNALGLCLARLGRMTEALAAFEKCAAVAPNFAPALFNSGWTLEDLGQLERARAAFEAAARLDPDSAEPPARLASLAARRGKWDEARALAEKALAARPGQPIASMALANAELAEKAYPAAEARLRTLLKTPHVGGRDRAVAVGLLADVLDAEGRFHEAFAAYEESNNQFRTVFADHPFIRSEIPMNEYVAWLARSFMIAPAGDWRADQAAASADDERRIIFVLGFPRSGTTLLEEILACHPDVATTGEKDALSLVVRELFSDPRQLKRLISLTPEERAHYREIYWGALGEFGVRGRVIVDKQPLNTIRLPLILKLFPNAKVVFCLRDPRDVILSCFRRRFVPSTTNMEFLTLSGTAKLYDSVMRLADTFKTLLGIRPFEIHNEQLVDDFDSILHALCDYVGLDWVEEFRNFATRSGGREVLTPSATQIQRGLASAGIGHWRNYKEELAPVLPVLAPWVKKFGYPEN